MYKRDYNRNNTIKNKKMKKILLWIAIGAWISVVWISSASYLSSFWDTNFSLNWNFSPWQALLATDLADIQNTINKMVYNGYSGLLFLFIILLLAVIGSLVSTEGFENNKFLLCSYVLMFKWTKTGLWLADFSAIVR